MSYWVVDERLGFRRDDGARVWKLSEGKRGWVALTPSGESLQGEAIGARETKAREVRFASAPAAMAALDRRCPRKEGKPS